LLPSLPNKIVVQIKYASLKFLNVIPVDKIFHAREEEKISLAQDKIFREKIAHQLAGAAWRAPRRREKFCMRMLETGRADLHVHA
jgi:hypothetical protein